MFLTHPPGLRTASPFIPLAMTHILRNAIGSTAELRAAIEFVAEDKLSPVVSGAVDESEGVRKGFEPCGADSLVELL